MGFVSEYPGWTYLGEIAGEFVFEDARAFASEIDVRRGTEHTEILPPSVIVVVTHAAVARNAAIHFMMQERSEFLVLMRSLPVVIGAVVMAGHDGHVLQMAMTTFLADRTIVRMIRHHE